MKINKFEDLPLWQESRKLSSKIYEATGKSGFRDFSLRGQMRRAVISGMSNIAEGFERGSNKEFIQFLYIAKGSLGELRSQTYAAHDNKYISESEFLDLINNCLEVSKNSSNFINYLKKSVIISSRHKEK